MEKYVPPHTITNSHNYYEQISMGNIKGVDRIYKFGSNEAVGTLEEIISYNGVYGLPTSADTVTVTSSSGDDAFPSGAGARTISIQGLDANWNLQEETINIGATSIGQYIRVFRAWVDTCGNQNPIGGANQGAITIAQTGGTPMVLIGPNEGQTLCAAYTIPDGYDGYVYSADATCGEGKGALLRLKTHEYDGDNAFRVQGARYAYQNTVAQKFKIPSKVISKTDIIFTGQSTASGTPISATFLISLVKIT